MIGLGRPLTAEPHLCADILSGKSKGAKANEVNQALQTGASILQIAAIASGKDIPDISDETTARKLEAIMMGKASEDEKPVKEQETKDYPKDN